MPITIVCSKCSATLSVPDSAAGLRARCTVPGCDAIVDVPDEIPAEELPVVEATLAPPPRPRPKPPPREDDDEDDRPTPQRPRRRRRQRTNGGAFLRGLAAVLPVVVGLALIGAVGFSVYWLVGKGSLFAKKKAAPPKGWVAYTSESARFKAFFPKEPLVRDWGEGLGPFKRGGYSGYDFLAEMDYPDGAGIHLLVVRFPKNLTEAERKFQNDDLRKLLLKGVEGGDTRMSEPRPVKWAGRDAEELTIRENGKSGELIVRFLITDGGGYIVAIGSDRGRLSSAEEKGFFENFELLD